MVRFIFSAFTPTGYQEELGWLVAAGCLASVAEGAWGAGVATQAANTCANARQTETYQWFLPNIFPLLFCDLMEFSTTSYSILYAAETQISIRLYQKPASSAR